MIKRFATTVALCTALAFSVPTWVSGAEVKKYHELTELQRTLFQQKALASVEPGHMRFILESEGAEVAAESEDWDSGDVMVFAGCYAEHFMEYLASINVITFMHLTDDEIEAHLGSYSFDVGARCTYEVFEKREDT